MVKEGSRNTGSQGKRRKAPWDGGSCSRRHCEKKCWEDMGLVLNRTNRGEGKTQGPTKYSSQCSCIGFPITAPTPWRDQAAIFPFSPVCSRVQFFFFKSVREDEPSVPCMTTSTPVAGGRLQWTVSLSECLWLLYLEFHRKQLRGCEKGNHIRTV